MSGGIYTIECVANGKVYVGSAKDFEGRWTIHLNNLRGNRHINPHLQRSFNKYGEESFKFERHIVIEGEYNKELYFEIENETMQRLGESKTLFNIAKAEGGWTYATEERKDEIKKKISDSMNERYASLTKEERKQMFGKHAGISRSEETKKKCSEALKGVKKSDATKKKMSDSQKKRTDLAECGRKVGLTNKGRLPPNTRRVLINDQVFISLKAAAASLGISGAALLKHINKEGKYGNVRYEEEKESQFEG
jgi:group I intron endonuclease